jgi:hypothetical protein
LDVGQRSGAIAYYDGGVLNEQVDKLAVGSLDVGSEDVRLVYEDSHTIG